MESSTDEGCVLREASAVGTRTVGLLLRAPSLKSEPIKEKDRRHEDEGRRREGKRKVRGRTCRGCAEELKDGVPAVDSAAANCLISSTFAQLQTYEFAIFSIN